MRLWDFSRFPTPALRRRPEGHEGDGSDKAMKELIERIRGRLAQSAYANEAAISHGIVTPILNALGWDSADPDQVVPEYAIQGRGRLDFALLGLGRRPAVFIEVKGLGLALNGDKQLFEYAFHHGVPLCVLTDGREWSFYLPAGQGSYDDRRLYRLQLDGRDPVECERVLTRYLGHDRVRRGDAQEDAQRDYRSAIGQREARAILPRAWTDLIAGGEEYLIELVADRAAALCGFRPSSADVLSFLGHLRPASGDVRPPIAVSSAPSPSQRSEAPIADVTSDVIADSATEDRSVRYTLFGEKRSSTTASQALVDILGILARRRPEKIADLADAVRGRSRSMIATSVAAINPGRPDLARAVEFAPGWLIGLNLSNRDKMAILWTACAVFDVRMRDDLEITLPNATGSR